MSDPPICRYQMHDWFNRLTWVNFPQPVISGMETAIGFVEIEMHKGVMCKSGFGPLALLKDVLVFSQFLVIVTIWPIQYCDAGQEPQGEAVWTRSAATPV